MLNTKSLRASGSARTFIKLSPSRLGSPSLTRRLSSSSVLRRSPFLLYASVTLLYRTSAGMLIPRSTLLRLQDCLQGGSRVGWESVAAEISRRWSWPRPLAYDRRRIAAIQLLLGDQSHGQAGASTEARLSQRRARPPSVWRTVLLSPYSASATTAVTVRAADRVRRTSVRAKPPLFLKPDGCGNPRRGAPRRIAGPRLGQRRPHRPTTPPAMRKRSCRRPFRPT